MIARGESPGPWSSSSTWCRPSSNCAGSVPGEHPGPIVDPLLRGEPPGHREHVISEYADNAEAMVRTEPWKLIHSAGNRRRRDGYAIGTARQSHRRGCTTSPGTLGNEGVADREENREIVES